MYRIRPCALLVYLGRLESVRTCVMRDARFHQRFVRVVRLISSRLGDASCHQAPQRVSPPSDSIRDGRLFSPSTLAACSGSPAVQAAHTTIEPHTYPHTTHHTRARSSTKSQPLLVRRPLTSNVSPHKHANGRVGDGMYGHRSCAPACVSSVIQISSLLTRFNAMRITELE